MHLRRVTRALVAVVALLAGVPAHAASDAHVPVVNCSAFWRTTGVLVFVGAASVPPAQHQAPVALTVTCTYRNERERYTSTNTAAGHAVTTFGAAPMAAGSMELCATAEAVYADGHVGTVEEPCHPPALGPPPEA